jgi:hypothetical protein
VEVLWLPTAWAGHVKTWLQVGVCQWQSDGQTVFVFLLCRLACSYLKGVINALHVPAECALPGCVSWPIFMCAGMLCCAVLCCSADDLQQAILKVGPMLEDANAAAVAAGHQSAAADARVRIRAGLICCRRGLGRAIAGVLEHVIPCGSPETVCSLPLI